MKKLAKIMAVFAAIMMALAFVGCNNDDDDDPSTVAVYKATEEYDRRSRSRSGESFCHTSSYESDLL